MIIIYGIVLAGGKASRMNQNKMLLDYDGQPIIYHSVKNMSSVCDKIVIITGEYQVDYTRYFPDDLDIIVIYNELHELGMFSSVKKGAMQIDDQCFIIPGDYPLIQPSTYKETLKQKGEIRVPTYKGRKGHPIFLEKNVVKELLDEPLESNLKAFRNKYQVTYFDVDDKGILLDIDNIDDYQQLITKRKD